jgi:hypothetical protein
MDISKMSITQTSAINNGGTVFVDNPGQSILGGDLLVTDSQAGVSGGVFYLNQAA